MSHCNVYTPIEQVKELLDIVGYRDNLYGKRILESSCGTGNFLIEIVDRYIKDSRIRNISDERLVLGLKNDIVGYEIDSETLSTCRKRLDELVKKYGISGVNWSLYCKNVLFIAKEKYDYVVGNPPFIAYKDINVDERRKLQRHFESCTKGKYDYYYAFVEDALNSLNNDGILAMILPSSVYKNDSASVLRSILLKNHIEVYDYNEKMVFKDVKTSCTILLCHKGKIDRKILYTNISDGSIIKVMKPSDKGGKWYFQKQATNTGKYKFGDYFSVNNSIATLCNKAFLLEDEFLNQDSESCEQLETKLIRPAVSPQSMQRKKRKFIIFPYIQQINGEIERIEEEDLERYYPLVYKHLKKFRRQLDSRASDKNVKWYEYGRTQGMASVGKEKLILSSVITGHINTYLVSKNTIPYAGFFIQQNASLPLIKAQKILESKEFQEYIKTHSINSYSKSIRISVNEILEFRFNQIP